jgi:cytochrome bd-type quinol oxidase subunit 1
VRQPSIVVNLIKEEANLKIRRKTIRELRILQIISVLIIALYAISLPIAYTLIRRNVRNRRRRLVRSGFLRRNIIRRRRVI